MDEALTIVTRMEAYSGSTTGVNDDSSRECVRMVAAPFEHKNDVDDRIGKLEETVQNQKDEIAKLKSRSGHAQRPSGPHAPGSSGGGAQGGHTGGNAVGRNGGAVVTAAQPPEKPQWTSSQAVLPTARGPAATAGAGPTQPPWQPRAAATPLAPGEAVQSLPAGDAMGQFGAYIDGSPVGYGGAYPATFQRHRIRSLTRQVVGTTRPINVEGQGDSNNGPYLGVFVPGAIKETIGERSAQSLV